MTRPAEIEAFERAYKEKVAALNASSESSELPKGEEKGGQGKGKKLKGNISKIISSAEIPKFRAGDKLRVQVRIREGETERLQAFEGVCIARHNAGLGSSFTVRKRSYGEGVERVFPLHSPNIAMIEVVQRGQVRRAKLYYLRDRQGKRARIAEDITRAREDRTELASQKAEKARENNEKQAAREGADS